MSFPKITAMLATGLFLTIGVTAFWKHRQKAGIETSATEIVVPIESVVATEKPKAPMAPVVAMPEVKPQLVTPAKEAPLSDEGLPHADRIEELFTTGLGKLPIVDTVVYTSKVSWLQGRPAWVVDYATYFGTSRHFIARSLNKKPDYLNQNVAEGDRFNVFKKDKELQFYLVIDVSRCKMWFYYYDVKAGERVLLKDYRVGLGRPQPNSPSGCLTPLGTYLLGPKVAIYKPGVIGTYQQKDTELIRVFGSRWIPFDKEVEKCSAPARGYGIHGAPWRQDEKTGQLVEDRACIGHFDSDGCVRLVTEDIEEIFSIVITKPTYVVVVNDFQDARLPGVEKT